MNNQHQSPAYGIHGMFPCPVYCTLRDSELSPKEDKDIEDIIKEGTQQNLGGGNSFSNNSYIFNTKLKKLKEFCEQHIKIYVKEIINPKEDLDFYITQSWLSITKPGQFLQPHYHSNSIISGVFYISTEEGDNIIFNDPNTKIKKLMSFETNSNHLPSAIHYSLHSINNGLLLFPSWIEHGVKPNVKATRDRISLSFNTFVKGNLGERKGLNQLILQ